jgi:xanthine dehydrogenase YagT iron-sulfur-binding subunit
MKKRKNGNEHEDSLAVSGVSRRGFLGTMGVGAAAVAGGLRHGQGGTSEDEGGGSSVVTLKINGREHRLLVEPRWTLLFVLREQLGLTGSKMGCERGECGACSVLIDGQPRYACMTFAVEAEGHEVTTVEGLMKGEELGVVQQAFLEEDAFQCGYCTPGQIIAVEGLLRKTPQPDLEQIRHGVSGNLCRCGAYAHIFNAADTAAKRRASQGGRS